MPVLDELEAYVKAAHDDPTPLLLSHRDSDKKNFMRTPAGELILVDWDSAGPVNPRHDLANEALVWAGVHLGDPDPTIARAFADAYRSASGMGEEFHATDLAELVALRLGWFEFNVHRALGERIRDDSDRQLGENAIRRNIEQLPRFAPLARRVARRPHGLGVYGGRHRRRLTFPATPALSRMQARYPYTRARPHNPADDHPHTRLRVVHIAALALGCALLLSRAGAPPRVTAQTPDDAFVERVLASLTPDERVGQLVMVNFVGDDVSASSDIAALIRDYQRRRRARHREQRQHRQPRRHRRTARRPRQRPPAARVRRDRAHRQRERRVLPAALIATDNEGDLFPFTNVTQRLHGHPEQHDDRRHVE